MTDTRPCERCGQPATIGPRGSERYCDDCRESINADMHASTVRRRARLAKAGICLRCAKQPATEGPRGGTNYCDDCREKMQQ